MIDSLKICDSIRKWTVHLVPRYGSLGTYETRDEPSEGGEKGDAIAERDTRSGRGRVLPADDPGYEGATEIRPRLLG